MGSRRMSGLLKRLAPLVALLLLCVMMSFLHPGFLTTNNGMNILRQTAVNGFISAGMLLTLITAGIDLSVGANAILTASVMGMLMSRMGV